MWEAPQAADEEISALWIAYIPVTGPLSEAHTDGAKSRRAKSPRNEGFAASAASSTVLATPAAASS